jgi:hypothetical protein
VLPYCNGIRLVQVDLIDFIGTSSRNSTNIANCGGWATAPVHFSLRITTKVLLWHLPIVGTTVRVIRDRCLGVLRVF